MPLNEDLVQRIRKLFGRQKAVGEIRMFGGVCFTLRGNMCCGTVKDDLVIRVGAEGHGKAMKLPAARPMDFTGKPMKGFVFVGPKGFKTDAGLRKAVGMAIDFVKTVPVKKG